MLFTWFRFFLVSMFALILSSAYSSESNSVIDTKNKINQTINSDGLTSVVVDINALKSKKSESAVSTSSINREVKKFLKINPQVQASLDYQWGTNSEGKLKKAAMFIPRLVGRPLKFIVNGQTSKTIQNLPKLLTTCLCPSNDPDVMHDRYISDCQLVCMDSPLIPLNTANELVSDVVSILKSPYYSLSRFTDRVQVATTSLMGCPCDFMFHVALLVDGKNQDRRIHGYGHAGEDQYTNSQRKFTQAMRESEQGKKCQGVPILSNDGELLAVEKVVWSSYKLRGLLNDENLDSMGECFCSHNCGAVVKEVLGFSDLGFPIFPNLGIGNELCGCCYNPEVAETVKVALAEHTSYIIHLFQTLELGERLTNSDRLIESLNENHSNDFFLQIVASAARGRDEGNRKIIVNNLADDFVDIYTDKNGNIRGGFKSMIETMFVNLNIENASWIQSNYPKVYAVVSKAIDLTKISSSAPLSSSSSSSSLNR